MGAAKRLTGEKGPCPCQSVRIRGDDRRDGTATNEIKVILIFLLTFPSPRSAPPVAIIQLTADGIQIVGGFSVVGGAAGSSSSIVSQAGDEDGGGTAA